MLIKQTSKIFEFDMCSQSQEYSNDLFRVTLFFCFFVHGDKGPFLIAEDASALKLPDSIRPEVKELINDSVTPATFNGMTSDNKYDCSGMVYYGTSLFSAQFHVYPNGLIEMVDDEPIVQDTAS